MRRPSRVFSLRRNPCSRSSGIGVHDGPESAVAAGVSLDARPEDDDGVVSTDRMALQTTPIPLFLIDSACPPFGARATDNREWRTAPAT